MGFFSLFSLYLLFFSISLTYIIFYIKNNNQNVKNINKYFDIVQKKLLIKDLSNIKVSSSSNSALLWTTWVFLNLVLIQVLLKLV
jgi:hypothetical protein